MGQDEYGCISFSEEDILEQLYLNPEVDVSTFKINMMDGHSNAGKYNRAVKAHYLDWPELLYSRYVRDDDLDKFDKRLQRNWYAPDAYMEFDIARWVLDQCKTDAELQRCGDELILFADRNMFPMLCYLRYFVDEMRKNKQIWGVGRGSSVASYVLYLIGVHRVDSLFYGLDIKEFLR